MHRNPNFVFWQERDLHLWAFHFLIFFSPFLFVFFLSFCDSDWPSFGLASVKKCLRKHHQILQEILLEVFHSNFWAFLCISQAPLSRSLRSGYHWKYLFLLQLLSIDDANFGQRWWHQKWNKGQCSSWPVTAVTCRIESMGKWLIQ